MVCYRYTNIGLFVAKRKKYLKKFSKNLIHRRDLDPGPDLDPELDKILDPFKSKQI